MLIEASDAEHILIILQVQKQVHQTLNSKEDALLYIEDLIVQMLGMLCSAQPHTLSDVEERVHKKILHPMDTWAIAEAQNAVERSKNKKTSQLVLPVDRIHQTLVKVCSCCKFSDNVELVIDMLCINFWIISRKY